MRSARLALVLALLVPFAGTAPARAAASRQMAPHRITQLESYMTLQPMYATILDDGRPVGLLLVAIGLNVPDAQLRAKTQRALPLLRDAYVRNLVSFAAVAVRRWKQPDVNMISARLQRATDRTLQTSGAQVLLSQVSIRITQ